MYEGLLLGCAGAIGGTLLALLLAWLINHSGITWNPPGNAKPILLTVRLWGEIDLLASTAFCLVCLTVVSAYRPARRAASMNIVEALRHI
jgi:putative ABC transport system permease protein